MHIQNNKLIVFGEILMKRLTISKLKDKCKLKNIISKISSKYIHTL